MTVTAAEAATAAVSSLALGTDAARLTLDTLCGGSVRVLQPLRGYRFTLDPVLLSSFAAQGPGPTLRAPSGPAIDLGTGGGIIPLLLARRFGWRKIVGLELQRALFELAVRNVRLNACEREVSVVHGDLRQVRTLFPRGGFAHVVSNPPFFRAEDATRRSPDAQRALARHEVACRLEDVARAAAWLLMPRGRFHVVFPAARLEELLATLREVGLSARRLRPVHPRVSQPARRVLVTAVQSAGARCGPGAASLEILPPLILHPDDGPGFTPEVQRMLAKK